MFSTILAFKRMQIEQGVSGNHAADFVSREQHYHQQIANLLEQNKEKEAKNIFLELEGTHTSNPIEHNWARLVADYKAGIFQDISTYRISEHQLPIPGKDSFSRSTTPHVESPEPKFQTQPININVEASNLNDETHSPTSGKFCMLRPKNYAPTFKL